MVLLLHSALRRVVSYAILNWRPPKNLSWGTTEKKHQQTENIFGKSHDLCSSCHKVTSGRKRTLQRIALSQEAKYVRPDDPISLIEILNRTIDQAIRASLFLNCKVFFWYVCNFTLLRI